jgi:predicted small lipoprotein YifL
LRNLGVAPRDSLCGMALFMPCGYHASASSLGRLDLAQNPRSCHIQRNDRMKKMLVLLFIVVLSGCGKKGALVPPEALVPAAISDLRVEQKGDRFLVLWSSPTRQEGGRALRNLAGFRLFRRDLLPPGEDCEECPEAYSLLTSIDPEYPRGGVADGNRGLYYDAALTNGKSYRYKVIAAGKDGSLSRPSNKADRKKVSPPPPPVLQALATPIGVRLTWQAPAAPASGRIEGYNVYRKRSGEIFPLSPLTGVPLKETFYEDGNLEQEARYTYVVRAIALTDGVTVESDPSNEVESGRAEPD